MQDGVSQTGSYPWIEFFPNPLQKINNFPIYSGNIVFSSVMETAPNSGVWTMYIQDETTNVLYNQNWNFAENRDTHKSAETITEWNNGPYTTFPYFAGVTFSSVWWFNSLGNPLTVNDENEIDDELLTTNTITSCIKDSNESANGFQTNWSAQSSCPD